MANREDEHPFCSLSQLAHILKIDLTEMRGAINSL